MPHDYPFILIGLNHNLCIVSPTHSNAEQAALHVLVRKHSFGGCLDFTGSSGLKHYLCPWRRVSFFLQSVITDIWGSYSLSGVVGGERSAAYTPSLSSHLSNTFPANVTKA